MAKGKQGKNKARQDQTTSASEIDPRVIYLETGKLGIHIPHDPDLVATEVRETDSLGPHRGKRLKNGLHPRTDIMARLVARGVSQVSAYRAARKASGEPLRDASRASAICRNEKFRRAVAAYRELIESGYQRAPSSIRDYVMTRLVHESQTAPESAARMRALDLLGKAEGMFTTVHRTERAINPSDLQALKAQLFQRVRQALVPLNHRLEGTGDSAHSHDTGSGDGTPVPRLPHTPHPPFSALGSNPEPAILIPRHDQELPPTPFEEVTSESSTEGGGFHREMTEDDL